MIVFCSGPPLLVRHFIGEDQVWTRVRDESEGDRKRMPQEIVRCPYCVLGTEFRPMFRRTRKFVCINCGHAVTPDTPYSRCACPKCQEALRLASHCRSVEDLGRSAGRV